MGTIIEILGRGLNLVSDYVGKIDFDGFYSRKMIIYFD